MKKYSQIFLILVFFLSVVGTAYGAGEEPGADFTHLKEYRGKNYHIIYPAKGYDKQLSILAARLDKIIPFVESYGAIKFGDVQITMAKSADELITATEGGTESGYVNITESKIFVAAGYYNENVVVHEVCHLVQKGLEFPSWFGEAHAENCARRYYESVGEHDRVKIYNDFYGSKVEKLKDVPSKVPMWIGESDLGTGDIGNKATLGAYLLMDELLKKVSMRDILVRMRQDFVVNESGTPKLYDKLLPNDAIICKINEIAPENIIPLFVKYGFKVVCNEKTYDFLKPYSFPKYIILILPGILIVIIAIIFLRKRKKSDLRHR